ncbi:MAG: alpha/beta hydrolase [Panacagrimonas sp.]|jgi:pimeloyl-ACP methyl ester carboxylesterase|nr:alpha/beta fold hydrolase [Panacagrimonas sp.]MCC2655176.1 alpha/beta hydrolase [Panacagrimonas sp.]
MSAAEAVILLHGLARSARPMEKLARAARDAGFVAFSRGYPSTTAAVRTLVDSHVAPQVREALAAGAPRVHFIGHSMGGILIRQYLAAYELPQVGRVVMIGTPNRGSELVDRLGRLAPFGWINGPAGNELGTGPDSLPNRLPPATYEAGIIAGTRSYNPAYSAMIVGANDGKVSVERAQLDGMRDLLVLPVNHTFMMRDEVVVRQSIHFLREGRFSR